MLPSTPCRLYPYLSPISSASKPLYLPLFYPLFKSPYLREKEINDCLVFTMVTFDLKDRMIEEQQERLERMHRAVDEVESLAESLTPPIW